MKELGLSGLKWTSTGWWSLALGGLRGSKGYETKREGLMLQHCRPTFEIQLIVERAFSLVMFCIHNDIHQGSLSLLALDTQNVS